MANNLENNRDDGAPTDFFPIDQLTTFRKIHDEQISDINLEIPTPSAERHVTDKTGFLIYGLALLICLPLMIYCAAQKSDIRIIFQLFEPSSDYGRDYLLDPFIIHSHFYERRYLRLQREAMYARSLDDFESMNEAVIFRNRRSHTSDDTQDPWLSSKKGWWKFLVSVAATIVVCTVVLSLIYCCSHVVIWLAIASIFGLLVTLIHGARLLNDRFDKLKYPTSPQFLIVMICIVFTVTCFAMLFFRRHLIHVTCFLYQEASRVIFPISKLLLLTLPMIPIQLFILSFSLFVALAIMAPSKSENISEDRFKYDHIKGLYLFLTVFITNWTMHLVGGFQCMVTAESVASKCFSGDQVMPNWWFRRSFRNIGKYHIGTVAFGSAIQPLVAIIDQFVRLCSCYRTRGCATFLPVEIKLAPFSNKIAYIVSAMHGQSYYKSGKRAFNLLITYAPFFYALKFRGGVILFTMKLNLIFYCTGISYVLFSDGDDVWLPTILCLFANSVIISMFIETIETAAHTLIICECENQFIKGDSSRPLRFISKRMDTVFKKSENMYEHELEDREKDGCHVRFY